MNETSSYIAPSHSMSLSMKSEPEIGKRVCCLYRVSTEKQVDRTALGEADIPMQRIECRQFAERMGWTIVREEQEEGVSGHKVRAANRDKLQTVKEAALRKEFDILLVFLFDRIGRISDETPFVVEWFARNGIRVWSAREGEQRFDSHVDRLVNFIRFWQADGESEKTSIRTSTRLGQIAAEGHFTGGLAPYGYKLEHCGRINKKGHELYDLAIDEDEAALVRYIFGKCVNEGRGAQSIANLLNSMKLKNRAGRNWHPATIQGMLKNEQYIGVVRSGDSHSEPIDKLQIISPELFSEAQQLIKSRKRTSGRERGTLNIREQHLLAGMVYCGHCGAKLCLTSSRNGRPRKDGSEIRRTRYACQTKTRKHEPCGGQTGYTAHIVDEIVEETVYEIFRKVRAFSREDMVAVGQNAKFAEYRATEHRIRRELSAAEDELSKLKAEVVKAIDGRSAFTPELLGGLISDAEQRCSELREEYAEIQRRIQKRETETAELARKYDRIIEWSDIYRTANIAEKRAIVSQLISRVDVFYGYRLKITFAISVEQFLLGLDIAI